MENSFFIFGGPTTNMTSLQRKRERREVFSVTKAMPSYLDWSEDTISFGRKDHPDYVLKPGQYPLVVDPIIGNTRFSKVLMDRGSSLNIMYARTLELMGIGVDKLRPSKSSFHGVALGKRVQPLGQIDLAEGLDALPRRNAMKWQLAGEKLVQSNPHKLQGAGVHDV